VASISVAHVALNRPGVVSACDVIKVSPLKSPDCAKTDAEKPDNIASPKRKEKNFDLIKFDRWSTGLLGEDRNAISDKFVF
jgi:hypothetical protein